MAEAALLETPPTPFDRFGDWPLAALLATSAAAGFWRTRRLAAS
jgi:apolipoprotein N-acyltransferase